MALSSEFFKSTTIATNYTHIKVDLLPTYVAVIFLIWSFLMEYSSAPFWERASSYQMIVFGKPQVQYSQI